MTIQELITTNQQEAAKAIRKVWTFSDDQRHTHTWHSREDFIENELPGIVLSTAHSVLDAVKNEALALIEIEYYKEWWCENDNQFVRDYFSHNDPLYCMGCGTKLVLREGERAESSPGNTAINELLSRLERFSSNEE